MLIFWWLLSCFFTCLRYVFEDFFWSLQSFRFCQITWNGHHFTYLIHSLLLLLRNFDDCFIFVWFIMNVTFVQIRFSFFHFLKVIRIFEHYFSFFIKRSSTNYSFKQLLSLFFISSWIYVAIFIYFVERLLL